MVSSSTNSRNRLRLDTKRISGSPCRIPLFNKRPVFVKLNNRFTNFFLKRFWARSSSIGIFIA